MLQPFIDFISTVRLVKKHHSKVALTRPRTKSSIVFIEIEVIFVSQHVINHLYFYEKK